MMLDRFFLRLLGITLGLPLIDGAVRFTQFPQPILYVPDGGTAKFVWNYHVDDRNSEFFTTSPEWYYSNSNGKTRIAADFVSIVSGRWQWNWYVSPSCPERLKHRLRKESVATLVISNVSTLDNGNYSCELVLRRSQNLRSSSQLIVTADSNDQLRFTKEVGEDVVFMFNDNRSILEVSWGIQDGDTDNLNPRLIKVDIFGVQKDPIPGYAGRVRFVGNLTMGQAWFKITNLNINDTNQYMAKIRVDRASSIYSDITARLTVIQPVTTTKLQQTSTARSSSDASSTSSTIPSIARNATQTTSSVPSTSIPKNRPNPAASSCTSIIATCVTIIVILVAVVIFLLIYIWKGREMTTRKRSLPNDKSMDLEAYENADQMDNASNTWVHDTSKQRQVEKELYETIRENKGEDSNIQTHTGIRTLTAREVSTGDPSGRRQERVPQVPQHYQELTNLQKGQHTPLYEPLDKRNASYSDNVPDIPRTYEQLNRNETGREYQSLQSIPKKEESKV